VYGGKNQADEWQNDQYDIEQTEHGLASVFLHTKHTEGDQQKEQRIGNYDPVPEDIIKDISG
jgi:hypothetical protein